MTTFIRDIDSVLDYTMDYSSYLTDGETITSSVWTPVDVTVDSASFDATSTTVWVSGGALPNASVTNRITTSAGRTDDRTIRLVHTDR